MVFLSITLITTDHVTFPFFGCSFEGNITLNPNVITEFTNCIIKGTISSGGVGDGDGTFTNCVTSMDQTSWDANATLGTGTFIDSQTGVTFTTPSPAYGDTNKNKFLPDPVINIESSGIFTNYETGLFGNTRFLGSIGAVYVPHVFNVGVLEDFTTINDATDILTTSTASNLSGVGVMEIIIESGTYNEAVSITSFSNPSVTDFIRLKAKAGDEHSGIVGAGVEVYGGIVEALTVDTDYTNIRDMYFRTGQGDGIEGVKQSGGSNLLFERVIAKSILNSSAWIFQGTSATLINCVAIPTGSDVGFNASSGTTNFYGCIADNNLSSSGCFRNNGGAIVSYNCVALGGYWVNAASGDYNITTSIAAPGVNSLLNQDEADMHFVNSGTDYHIGAESILLHAGGNYSGVYTTDVDGDVFGAGAYPIGIDYNLLTYVNLGTNTDADSEVASGKGNIDSPLNAGAWIVAVKDGGVGTVKDNYVIKGSAYTIENVNNIAKAEGWDIGTNGPWRLRIDKQVSTTRFGYVATPSEAIFEDLVLNIDHVGGSNIALYGNFTNSLLLTNASNFILQAGCTYKGTTVEKTLLLLTNDSDPYNFENCIFREVFSWSTGSSSHTMNSASSVFVEESSDPSDFNGFGTITDSDSQFLFVPETPVPDWLEVDKHKFVKDIAVRILGTNVYTGYETGLFGNPRKIDSLGGSYIPQFDIVPKSGVVGSNVLVSGEDLIVSFVKHTFDGDDGDTYTQTGPGAFEESDGSYSVSVDGENTSEYILPITVKGDFFVDFTDVFNDEDGSTSNGTLSVSVKMDDNSIYGFELRDNSDMVNFLYRSTIFNNEVTEYDHSLDNTYISALRIERKNDELIFSEKLESSDSFSLIYITTVPTTNYIESVVLNANKGLSGAATKPRPRGIGQIDVCDYTTIKFNSAIVEATTRTVEYYEFNVPNNPPGDYTVIAGNSFSEEYIGYEIETNVQPSYIQLSNNYILEGSPNGTLIGYLTASDDNLPGDAHTFSLNDDADGRFYIHNTDELRLLDTERVRDMEADSHYINIEADDLDEPNDGSYSQGFYVDVGHDPTLPAVIDSFSAIVVEENSNEEVIVNGLNFIDGGDPTVYIDGEIVEPNSFDNRIVRITLPSGLSVGTHTLRIINGNGL
jgi:hypothetical protein